MEPYSECKCLSQDIYFSVWKKKTKWYQGWAWAPLFVHSETITINADSVEGLKTKIREVKAYFQTKFPDMEVYAS